MFVQLRSIIGNPCLGIALQWISTSEGRVIKVCSHKGNTVSRCGFRTDAGNHLYTVLLSLLFAEAAEGPGAAPLACTSLPIAEPFPVPEAGPPVHTSHVGVARRHHRMRSCRVERGHHWSAARRCPRMLTPVFAHGLRLQTPWVHTRQQRRVAARVAQHRPQGCGSPPGPGAPLLLAASGAEARPR